MGTKKTIALVYVLAFAGLTACGHKGDPAVQTSGATTPGQPDVAGGRCGERVAQDYQRLNATCRFSRDRGETFRCRQAAVDFLQRYPQVSCTMIERDFRGGGAREQRIEAREIRELLERLGRGGF